MSMKVIQVSNSVAANSTTANLIVGNQFEFLDTDSLLDFGFTIAATGIEITTFIGDRTMGRSLIPIIKATSPIFPDDFILFDVAGLMGERLIIEARNTTGAAIVVLTTIRQKQA